MKRSTGAKTNNSVVKCVGFGIVSAIAILLMIIKPCVGLGVMGHLAMGVTLITVAAWIFRPWGIPCSVSGFFLLGMMLIVGMPAGVVFSGFSQSALWTLIPALFFGFALQKTGLGRRIATGLLAVFPAKWWSIALAWVIIGVVLSLITPSMTVRAAIMIPIAADCCELYGLKEKSKGAAFFVITALMMAIVPGNGWLTGGLNGPIIQGVFDSTPGLEGVVTFDSWMTAALMPAMVTTVVTVILGFLFLHPHETLSKERFIENSKNTKCKLTSSEIKTAGILVAACILFFTGNIHGAPSAAICLLAVVLLFATRVLEPGDFITGINWDLIFFVGSGLCMSQIFAESSLSHWLSVMISPVIGKLAERPVILIFIMLTVLFVWRFVDVTTLVPTIVILAPIVSTVSSDYGINPMIWTVLFALAISSIFLSYTNMWAFMGKKLAGPHVWEEQMLFKYGTAYFIACCVGVACAIPFWMMAGMI